MFSSIRTLTAAEADRGPGPDVGGLVVPLGFDQRQVVRDVVKGLANLFQGHAVFAGELLGRIGIGTVDGLVNDRGADAATLEKELAVVRARPRLQVLVLRGGRGSHGRSSRIWNHL